MPTYDDPRLTYDGPSWTYDGTWIAPGLSGPQPTASGSLAVRVTYKRALAGAEQTATGTITRRYVVYRSLTGAQLTATGTITRKLLRQLAAIQPEPSGQLLPRLTYLRTLIGSVLSGETGELARRLSLKRTEGGTQPPATGEPNPRPYHVYRVTLTGSQPITYQYTYDEPGVTYDASGLTYDAIGDPAQVTWRLFYRRLLAGIQGEPTSELVWKWNPYVWAEYRISITDRPEVTQYQFDLDADDHEITYDVSEADLHDDVVYKVAGVRVYTAPPPGVRQKA